MRGSKNGLYRIRVTRRRDRCTYVCVIAAGKMEEMKFASMRGGGGVLSEASASQGRYISRVEMIYCSRERIVRY